MSGWSPIHLCSSYMRQILIFFLPFLSFCTFSQETSVQEQEADEIIDELLTENLELDDLMDSLSNFQFLYVSITYNNDTYFSGRDIGIDQYNVRPQISYMHSKGFFGSLTGAYYSEFDPNWDFTATTLGYTKGLGKKMLVRYYSSYTKYFYSEGVENPFGNAIAVGIGIKNKQRTLGTQLYGTYLFGEDNSFQISSRSSYQFKLINSKKTNLRFRPQLGIVIGQQTFELAQTTFQNGALIIDYIENDVFALINTQLNLPLQLTCNSFDIEFGYNLNFPSAIGDESNLPTTGFFNFSLAYLIDF